MQIVNAELVRKQLARIAILQHYIDEIEGAYFLLESVGEHFGDERGGMVGALKSLQIKEWQTMVNMGFEITSVDHGIIDKAIEERKYQ